jgi:septum site-determining protein MinC
MVKPIMKLRGTSGGLSILLEPSDTKDSVSSALESRAQLLSERVELELGGVIAGEVVQTVMNAILSAGGVLSSFRPPRGTNQNAPATIETVVAQVQPEVPSSGRTEIIARTLRSGTRKETPGSVIVLGDVNSGVELVAGGDIIVVGTLRGLAHAGATGRKDAIIWAQKIASPQIRIGQAIARASESSSIKGMQAREGDTAELAKLEGDHIVIEAFKGS